MPHCSAIAHDPPSNRHQTATATLKDSFTPCPRAAREVGRAGAAPPAAGAVGVRRVVLGPGWGMLPLLAAGAAVAAAVDGPLYALAAGAVALAVRLPFAAGMQPPGVTHHLVGHAFLAVVGVTAASAPASRARRRQDQELAQARLVAEAAQKVLLPPVPRQAGPVPVAARYLSPCCGAPV